MTPEQPRQRPKSYWESLMDGEIDPMTAWKPLLKQMNRQRRSQQVINWALFIFAATGAVTGILALVLR